MCTQKNDEKLQKDTGVLELSQRVNGTKGNTVGKTEG